MSGGVARGEDGVSVTTEIGMSERTDRADEARHDYAASRQMMAVWRPMRTHRTTEGLRGARSDRDANQPSTPRSRSMGGRSRACEQTGEAI